MTWILWILFAASILWIVKRHLAERDHAAWLNRLEADHEAWLQQQAIDAFLAEEDEEDEDPYIVGVNWNY